MPDYETMALFVAKELQLSPIDILNKWSENQLIISWGYYMNLKHREYYYSLEPNKRNNEKDYAIYFMDSYKYEIKEKIEAQFNGHSRNIDQA